MTQKEKEGLIAKVISEAKDTCSCLIANKIPNIKQM